MKIALIGVGNLGLSIANGLVKQKDFEIEQLILTDKHIAHLEKFKAYDHVQISQDSKSAVSASDIVILCVQPKQINGILNEISDVLVEGRHILISTVTGRKLSEIAEAAGKDVTVIRSMPNTAISVGQSMTCLSTTESGKSHIDLAVKIFNAMGETLVIEEEMMQAATVICASGIAFWMRLIRATTQGAIQLGFDAPEAQHMAQQACMGAASLLVSSDSHPEAEIDRVTTPQGCTIAGLNEMEHEGLSSALIKGLMKSHEKISEIIADK